MVGFEGWLGAKVVSSNLAAGIITIHMAVALLIVAVLIYTVSRARLSDAEMAQVARLPLIKKVLLVCIGLTFIQIVLGTQVRARRTFGWLQSRRDGSVGLMSAAKHKYCEPDFSMTTINFAHSELRVSASARRAAHTGCQHGHSRRWL